MNRMKKFKHRAVKEGGKIVVWQSQHTDTFIDVTLQIPHLKLSADIRMRMRKIHPTRARGHTYNMTIELESFKPFRIKPQEKAP